MYEYLTIAHVALITGLTDRTVRSHIKKGLLQGETINGLWHFTQEQVYEYMQHPSVAHSVKARRNALVHDFLSDEYRREPETCLIFDAPATLTEANRTSEFFCDALNADKTQNLRFSFSYRRGVMRVILKGDTNAVLALIGRYRGRV